MSRIGVVVSGRTTEEIFQAAKAARSKLNLGLNGRLVINNIESLLEARICPSYGVDLDVVDDKDPSMEGVHAAYDYADRVLRLRSSVLRKAQNEDVEALFTIFHELGHICLHSNPEFFRREFPKHLPKKICDPEWQADRFAVEFCIDRTGLMEMFKQRQSAAAYFRLPLNKLRVYLAELDLEGKLESRKLTAADSHFTAVQEDFDF